LFARGDLDSDKRDRAKQRRRDTCARVKIEKVWVMKYTLGDVRRGEVELGGELTERCNKKKLYAQVRLLA
jgi:hypothetical protein